MMRSNSNDGAGIISLSSYDQSLGIGLPALFRMLCFDYMPDPERLAVALDRALVRFPRYATKIARTPEGGSTLIPLDEPLIIDVRPPVQWTTADFKVGQVPAFVGGLETIPGRPVLAVTLTPVTRGAVLSVSFSHAVGDLCSLYLFLAYLSEQYRDLDRLPATPGTAHPRTVVLGQENIGAPARRGLADPASSGAASPRKLEYDYTTIKFDRDFLDSLRAELSTGDAPPTINEALTAFLVHKYGAEVMGRTTGLRLRVPVNVRGMHPAIPDDFIGNAILEAIVPLDELVDSPVAAIETVQRIRDAIAAAKNKEHIEETLFVRDSSIGLKGKGLPVYDRETDILSTVTSSMHFHKLDFGAGVPTRCIGMSTAYKGFSIGSAANGREVHVFSEPGSILSIGSAQNII